MTILPYQYPQTTPTPTAHGIASLKASTARCDHTDRCVFETDIGDGWCHTCKAFRDEPRGPVAVVDWDTP